MSDIVELLSVPYEEYLLDNALDDIKAEAAAEILRLRAENEKLRTALEPFAELGMRQAPGSDGDTFIVNIPKASDIRTAAAALKETGDE